MPTEFRDDAGDPHCRDYVIGFFDLQGQADQLAALKRIPGAETKGDEKERFRKAEKEMVDLLKAFRSFWRRICDDYNKNKLKALEDLALPDELKAGMRSVQASEALKFQGFGDTVVPFTPLGNQGRSQILMVQVMLLTAAHSMVMFMRQGYPFRGGIDVGTGIEIFEGEIYGPVLAATAKLESEVAKWPRIVVGERMVSFLDEEKEKRSREKHKTAAEKVAGYLQYEAEECRSWIIKDVDGVNILDYLSPKIIEFIPNLKAEFEEHLQVAFAFVEHEMARFSREGNRKLADRYREVAKYFSNRVPRLVGNGGLTVERQCEPADARE